MGKKQRSIIALFIICIMILASGCQVSTGNSNSSEASGNGMISEVNHDYPEFITVTVFDTLANYSGLQSGWFAKIVRDKFNMELDIIAPNLSPDADAMYNDRVSSGNVGDLIITANGEGQLQNLVEAGLVLDLRPYMQGTNLEDKYEKAITSLNDTLTSGNSNSVYALPTNISVGQLEMRDMDTPVFGAYMRYDLYQELGSPKVNTLEDLLPILKEMQQLYPKDEEGNSVYAFSLFGDWDENMTTFAKQPACMYGFDEYGFVLVSADGSQFQNILDKDSLYARSLRFYYKANQMGLLDPESGNLSYNEVFAKTQKGQVLFAPWPWLGQSAYNTSEHLQQGKAMMFIPIEDENIYCYGAASNGLSNTIVAVGAQTSDPARMVDFVDWLYSDEGIYTACAQRNQAAPGPEGLNWEMTEEGPALTDFGVTALLENGDVKLPDGWGGGTWAEGTCQLNFVPVSGNSIAENGYSYYYEQWDSVRNMSKSDIELQWSDTYGAGTVMEYLKSHNQFTVAPVVTIQKEGENTELSTIRKQCSNIIVNYSWKMIFATSDDEFEKLFEEMRSRTYDCGYESIYEYDLNYVKEEGAARQEYLRNTAENTALS